MPWKPRLGDGQVHSSSLINGTALSRTRTTNNMYLLSLLTEYFLTISSPIYTVSRTPLRNVMLMEHTQGLPSSSLELPSVTALATMPCTAFAERFLYDNTIVCTFDRTFPERSMILPPSRPTRRVCGDA